MLVVVFVTVNFPVFELEILVRAAAVALTVAVAGGGAFESFSLPTGCLYPMLRATVFFEGMVSTALIINAGLS